MTQRDADRYLDALDRAFVPVEPGDLILSSERGLPYKRAVTLSAAPDYGMPASCVAVSATEAGDLSISVERLTIRKFTPVVNKRDAL